MPQWPLETRKCCYCSSENSVLPKLNLKNKFKNEEQIIKKLIDIGFGRKAVLPEAIKHVQVSCC
jgi:hypothetical protein